ncbi:MAG: carboxy terminal-processing peptidase [Verrucomicrobiota bacterium]|nr:carboxy terminal-processing peptidase [Verrucomicrobiota bacterium]
MTNPSIDSRHKLLRVALVALSLLLTPALHAFEGWSSLTREDQRRMALETNLAIEFLQENHFKRMPFSQVDAKELLTSYMKDLDYARMFFTQTDQDEVLLRFGDTLKTRYLQEGNLYPAFEIYSIYRQRALDRCDWVFKRLKGDFDFKGKDTFAPDRSESPFSKDTTSMDLLWEDRIKFELLGEMLGGDTLEGAKEKIQRRYTRTQRFINETESYNVQEIFLNSLSGLYDPHSNFFSAQGSAEEFNIQITNTLSGIGAVLRDEDGYCVIQELVAGGPAELSGQLFPGDKVEMVAQEKAEPVDATDMKLRKVVSMIRGEKGTKVILTLIPANATDPSERKRVTLVRDEIKLTENLASARVFESPLEDGSTVPIGVIELPSFYGGMGRDSADEATTSKDVEELINKLKPMGVQGIVLDLRRNGGGLLSEAIRLGGLFIPKGPIVMVKDTTGQTRTDWDSDSKLAWDGPLIILVSRNSASASEIVAGALQSMGRALVIGDKATHGKGTVQQPWELARSLRRLITNKADQLGTMKVTIQKFYLPNGASTQNEGVVSDIAIPSINDYLKIGESDLPNALVWDTIEPVEWNPQLARLPAGKILDKQIIQELKEKSENRRKSLEEFKYLETTLSRFKERQDQKDVSLNLEDRQKQKEEDKKFREEMELERDRLAALNPYKSEEILLNLSAKKEQIHQEKLLSSTLPNGMPKANNFYQKVYYYQATPDDPIKEIYIDYLDYEKAQKSTATIAAALSAKLGDTVSTENLNKFFNYMHTADLGRDPQVEKNFASNLGLPESQSTPLLPTLFREIVQLDKDALKTVPTLDIPLRESLRVMVDWLQLEDSPFAGRVLAAKTNPVKSKLTVDDKDSKKE